MKPTYLLTLGLVGVFFMGGSAFSFASSDKCPDGSSKVAGLMCLIKPKEDGTCPEGFYPHKQLTADCLSCQEGTKWNKKIFACLPVEEKQID